MKMRKWTSVHYYFLLRSRLRYGPGDSDEAEAEEADSGGGASLAASSDAVVATAGAGAVDLNWRKPERWYSARASSACCTVLCIPGVRILPP